MPGEEGKPKESQGEADGEEGNDGDHDHDHNHRVDDEAERKRLENEEAERYIQLYLDGYKKKQVLRHSQDRDEQRDSHHQQHDHQLAPPRSSISRRSSLEAAYNEKIAHYEGVLQQMQETREQMHHEIDELMRQLEETKLDAARLLRELELREAPPAQGNSGGEEGPDEPLREETARMVDDLRALIIEREEQLAELRSELGRRTAEIDALMRERDDEAAAARDAARQCEDLRAALEANELERNEVQSTLDQVLGQASAMHEELMEKQARLAELEDLALRSAHDADADAEAQLELERLREVIEAHRQAVDELTRRLAAKRKRNAECKQQIAELEESMVEKQAELDMMTRNRNALYQRCEELEADRERVQLEQEAERAAKEDKRSQKAAAAAAAAAALEQAQVSSSSQAKLAADRRLLHELGEAKKQLRQRRQQVVEFDQILAEMANASRASEAQVAAWEHQLLACRQRITELGSPVGPRETNERGSRVAISECEADVEVLQRQVMAELDGMRELAQRYEQVKQRRDEAARACDELAHAASAIKQRILTSRKRSKARRSTSMTGMTSRASSNSGDLAGQVSHDNAPALDKLVHLQWVRVF
jgi:chromosome segregation ATPase